jgi:hypothetical protein
VISLHFRFASLAINGLSLIEGGENLPKTSFWNTIFNFMKKLNLENGTRHFCQGVVSSCA